MPTSNFNYIVVKKLGFSMRHAIMYISTYIIDNIYPFFFHFFVLKVRAQKHIFSNFFNCKLFCQKIVIIILETLKSYLLVFPFHYMHAEHRRLLCSTAALAILCYICGKNGRNTIWPRFNLEVWSNNIA